MENLWEGPEPPHLKRHVLDDVRSVIIIRDPEGLDGVCRSGDEITFCTKYLGRCAFTPVRLN